MQSEEAFWLKRIKEHQNVIETLSQDQQLLKILQQVASKIVTAIKSGHAIYICGNGGSAADAQHFAAELVGRFYKERAPINAEALTVNTSTITALANDYNYDGIFRRQLAAKGKKGDVFIGISTSGNSKNILNAMIWARENALYTVGLTGYKKSTEIAQTADVALHMPSSDTPRIQEMHILVIHMLCEYIENNI